MKIGDIVVQSCRAQARVGLYSKKTRKCLLYPLTKKPPLIKVSLRRTETQAKASLPPGQTSSQETKNKNSWQLQLVL